MRLYLGADIGSVSVKMALIDQDGEVKASAYTDTAGAPLEALVRASKIIRAEAGISFEKIYGVGVTGSGRRLGALALGADVVKNEITAQTVAAIHYDKRVSSVIEIGGQDSKIILLNNGVPVWHNLNTLCAAGTGSFLASQAARLNIPIEEFGAYALRSKMSVNIASKCTVFSESDMIHKAAIGCRKEDIINGLCESMVRNFISSVARNRDILEPILFVGGVAANAGVVRAFEKALNKKVTVPKEHRYTGCIGMALLAMKDPPRSTKFMGFDRLCEEVVTDHASCGDCPNSCELVSVRTGNELAGRMGSMCGKHNV